MEAMDTSGGTPRGDRRLSRRLSPPHTASSDDHDVQMVQKVGRHGDREKAAIRGWLSDPATTATSKGSSDLLPEVNIWAQLKCRDFDKLEITSRQISGILGTDRTGRVKGAKVGSTTLWTIRRAPDPPGRTSMDLRTARRLRESDKQLNQLKKMEVRAMNERSSSSSSSPSSAKKGVAVYKTSVRHALHIRESLLLTGSSQRQFPKAAFLIVRSAIEELKLGHLVSDTDILKIIPTNLSAVLEKCQRIDEQLLVDDLKKSVDAVFSVNGEEPQGPGQKPQESQAHSRVEEAASDGKRRPCGCPDGRGGARESAVVQPAEDQAQRHRPHQPFGEHGHPRARVGGARHGGEASEERWTDKGGCD